MEGPLLGFFLRLERKRKSQSRENSWRIVLTLDGGVPAWILCLEIERVDRERIVGG